MAPTPSKPDADVVARAAEEKAHKLEQELAAMRIQLEAAKREQSVKMVGSVAVVPGTKTYRLTQPHYRRGMLYQPGEKITVTDEVPGKTWVLLKEVEAAPTFVDAAPTKSVRPSDQQV